MNRSRLKGKTVAGLAALLIFLHPKVSAGIGLGLLNRATEAQNKAVQRATSEIEKEETTEKLRRKALEAIKEADTRFDEVAEFGAQIEKERESLAKEKATLVDEKNTLVKEQALLKKEKDKVERREKAFSRGLYTSLFANFVAFGGFMLRVPNSRLDRQLKLLKIAEKEQELKNKGIPIP